MVGLARAQRQPFIIAVPLQDQLSSARGMGGGAQRGRIKDGAILGPFLIQSERRFRTIGPGDLELRKHIGHVRIAGSVDPETGPLAWAAHQFALEDLQPGGIALVGCPLVAEKIAVDGRDGTAQLRRQGLDLLADGAHPEGRAVGQCRVEFKIRVAALDLDDVDGPRHLLDAIVAIRKSARKLRARRLLGAFNHRRREDQQANQQANQPAGPGTPSC